MRKVKGSAARHCLFACLFLERVVGLEMLFKRRKHGLPGFFFKGEVAVQQLFALRGQGAARPFGAALLGVQQGASALLSSRHALE